MVNTKLDIHICGFYRSSILTHIQMGFWHCCNHIIPVANRSQAPRFAAAHHRAAHVGGLHARGATPGETSFACPRKNAMVVARHEWDLMGFNGILMGFYGILWDFMGF